MSKNSLANAMYQDDEPLFGIQSSGGSLPEADGEPRAEPKNRAIFQKSGQRNGFFSRDKQRDRQDQRPDNQKHGQGHDEKRHEKRQDEKKHDENRQDRKLQGQNGDNAPAKNQQGRPQEKPYGQEDTQARDDAYGKPHDGGQNMAESPEGISEDEMTGEVPGTDLPVQDNMAQGQSYRQPHTQAIPPSQTVIAAPKPQEVSLEFDEEVNSAPLPINDEKEAQGKKDLPESRIEHKTNLTKTDLRRLRERKPIDKVAETLNITVEELKEYTDILNEFLTVENRNGTYYYNGFDIERVRQIVEDDRARAYSSDENILSHAEAIFKKPYDTTMEDIASLPMHMEDVLRAMTTNYLRSMKAGFSQLLGQLNENMQLTAESMQIQQAAINDIYARIDSLKAPDMSGVNSRLDSATEGLARIEFLSKKASDEARNQYVAIDDLKRAVEDTKRDAERTERTVSTLSNDLADSKRDSDRMLNSISSAIGQIRSSNNGSSDSREVLERLEELSARIDESNGRIEEILSNQAEADYSGYEEQHEADEAAIAELEQKFADVSAELEMSKANAETLKGLVAKVSADADDADDKVSDLTEQLSARDAEIERLLKENRELKERAEADRRQLARQQSQMQPQMQPRPQVQAPRQAQGQPQRPQRNGDIKPPWRDMEDDLPPDIRSTAPKRPLEGQRPNTGTMQQARPQQNAQKRPPAQPGKAPFPAQYNGNSQKHGQTVRTHNGKNMLGSFDDMMAAKYRQAELEAEEDSEPEFSIKDEEPERTERLEKKKKSFFFGRKK